MSFSYNYISVNLHPELVPEMIELLVGCGIPPGPKHDFHATVMFDERKDEITEGLVPLDPDRVYLAYVVGVQELGDGYVFNLHSPELMRRHQELVDGGYKHAFPTVHLHMTLTYDPSKYEMLMLNQHAAAWAGRELRFTGECFGFKKNA